MASNEILNIIIEATDKASSKLGGIGKALGTLGKAGAAGAAVFAGATATIGAGLFALTMAAAPLEGIQGAFEGLAESTGKSSTEMLTALTNASSGMISGRDLMTSYNQAAQLVGITFANQLPDAMQYLSKVSAATGKDMGLMLDSLVTGVGRVSPEILDNLQVQVTLAQATARAAEMFGVEADALSKAQLQAGMMDVVLAQLATNTANMPEVAGTAAAGFATIGASMQNLKDQISLQLLPVMQPFLQSLVSLATTYGPQVVAMFGQFADRLGTTLPPAIALVNDALTRMSEVFTGSTEPVTAMDVVFDALKATLDAGIIAVQLIAITMQGLATAVEAVSSAVQAVNDAVNAGIEGWTKFGEAASAAIGFMTGGGGTGAGGIGTTGAWATGGNIPGVPQFASGGIVPGATGQPQLAVVHGGETILPTHQGGDSGAIIEDHITITLDGEVVGRYTGRKTAQMRRLGGYATL